MGHSLFVFEAGCGVFAFLDAGGLTVGGETTEAEALWAAAVRQAPRMQTPFDAVWWAGLLARRAESTGRKGPADQEFVFGELSRSRTSEPRQDWGEAPDVLRFVGRTDELAQIVGMNVAFVARDDQQHIIVTTSSKRPDIDLVRELTVNGDDNVRRISTPVSPRRICPRSRGCCSGTKTRSRIAEDTFC